MFKVENFISRLISKLYGLLVDQSSRNSFFSLAQALLTIFTYFAVMRRVVLALGLETLGLWSLAMSLVAFTRILDLGLASVPARMVAAKTGDELSQTELIDSTALIGLAAFTAIALVAYYALKPVLFGLLEPKMHEEAAWLLFGIVAALPLNCLAVVHFGALDGVGRADIRALVGIAGLTLYAATALLLISHFRVMALIYAQFVQHIWGFIAARIILCKQIIPLTLLPVRFDLPTVRPAISFGFRMQLATLPISLFDPLCRLLIGRSAGLELLAIYELASKYAASTRTLVQAFANPVLPNFARQMMEDIGAARAQYSTSQTVISSAGLFITIAQILGLPLISFILLSSIDLKFVIVSAALGLAWGLTCIGLVPQLYARAAGRLRYAMLGQWMLLILGGALVPLAALLRGDLWPLVAPALAILIGHLIAYQGEIRYFGLKPFGSSAAYLVCGLAFALTIIASIAIGVSLVILGIEV